jgi:hypothetical protein
MAHYKVTGDLGIKAKEGGFHSGNPGLGYYSDV